MQWEREHPHRRSRLEKRYPDASTRTIDVKYAESAMRGVGLEWPGKPNDRRKKWADCVRALGLTVAINPIPFLAKRLLKSDRSVEAQISRFLYQGVDMIQEGKDFYQTLEQLGCTPRNIFSWLKRQRKGIPKNSNSSQLCTMEDLMALVESCPVKDEKNA